MWRLVLVFKGNRLSSNSLIKFDNFILNNFMIEIKIRYKEYFCLNFVIGCVVIY